MDLYFDDTHTHSPDSELTQIFRFDDEFVKNVMLRSYHSVMLMYYREKKCVQITLIHKEELFIKIR